LGSINIVEILWGKVKQITDVHKLIERQEKGGAGEGRPLVQAHDVIDG